MAVPKLWFLRSCLLLQGCGQNGPNNNHSLAEHLCHVASTTSTVASLRVARLGWLLNKTTTAWWLASNLTNAPLFMKWQINNQKSQSFPNTNLHRLEKTGRYLQLRSFTSFALHDLYSCSYDKVVILTQLTFAVEMWAQTGQITNTAWQNTCAMLPVQLQQWHPCEWQD